MGEMESLEKSHTEPLIRTPSQLLTIVLLSFFIPVVVILLVVKAITGGITVTPNALTETSVKARLAPVGRIKLSGTGVMEKTELGFSADNDQQDGNIEEKSGEVVYNEVCISCHLSGIAGAPKTNDKVAWAPRISKGNDTLYKNAINGIGLMPAKGGGASFSDNEIKAAVDYMILTLQ